MNRIVWRVQVWLYLEIAQVTRLLTNTHSQVGGTLLVSPGLIWEHKDLVPSTHLEHSLRYGRLSVCLCQGGSFEFSAY